MTSMNTCLTQPATSSIANFFTFLQETVSYSSSVQSHLIKTNLSNNSTPLALFKTRRQTFLRYSLNLQTVMFFPLVIEKNIACQSDIKRFFPSLRLQDWGAIIVEREMDYLRLAASLP